jgi:hypothetical protein
MKLLLFNGKIKRKYQQQNVLFYDLILIRLKLLYIIKN